MKYTNTLGIIGNINLLLRKETETNNNFINHKSSYDIDHLNMELALTENDLNNISAEQTITELDLRVIELERKVQ